MARQNFSETQVPTAIEEVPYPDFGTVSRGLGKHMTEAFVGEVTGAGGVGGSLTGIPFDPAVVVVSEATGPLIQLQIPGSAAKVDINMITGADAAVAVPDAAVQPDGTWTIALPTTIVPDADVASVLCLGFRAVGSL